ncbi:hypothetical protein [Microbacterium sp. NPDC058389]|uniref:hypothetical protein n=1 Tax=Microbacterium sp. NPDC058389 TaxID=3346475 RepID=UPI00366604F9
MIVVPVPHAPALGPGKSDSPHRGASMDDAARLALARLDPRKATPESVQAALGAVGLHLPVDVCADWLENRRSS